MKRKFIDKGKEIQGASSREAKNPRCQGALKIKPATGFYVQIGSNPPLIVSREQASFGVKDQALKFLGHEIELISGHNGLICVGIEDKSVYVIVNPYNENWVPVKRSTTSEISPLGAVLAVEGIPKYHLVMAEADISEPRPSIQLAVYSSTSGETDIIDTGYTVGDVFHSGLLDWDAGVYVKESVFWKCESKLYEYEIGSSKIKVVATNIQAHAILGTVGGQISVGHMGDDGFLIFESVEEDSFELKEVKRVKPAIEFDRNPELICFADNSVLLRMEDRLFILDILTGGCDMVADGCNADVKAVPYVQTSVQLKMKKKCSLNDLIVDDEGDSGEENEEGSSGEENEESSSGEEDEEVGETDGEDDD